MSDEPRDPDCIFCRIVAGEIPAAEVARTDEVVVFMDAFPSSRGHTLVIPKAHYPTLMDMPPALLQTVGLAVQDVALAIRAALAPDGIALSQFNGEAAGQTVFHYHQHLIPRWQGQDRRSHGKDQADSDELNAVAALIRAELPWAGTEAP